MSIEDIRQLNHTKKEAERILHKAMRDLQDKLEKALTQEFGPSRIDRLCRWFVYQTVSLVVRWDEDRGLWEATLSSPADPSYIQRAETPREACMRALSVFEKNSDPEWAALLRKELEAKNV